MPLPVSVSDEIVLEFNDDLWIYFAVQIKNKFTKTNLSGPKNENRSYFSIK